MQAGAEMPGQAGSVSFGPAQDWGRLRSWDGSQHRAFEELCFQLRDPAPSGWRTIKTGNPDGGVEWYDLAPDGTAYGGQAKFVGTVDALISLARESVQAVGANRDSRDVVRLTFYAPFDMPDPAPKTPSGRRRRGARQRWVDAVAGWKLQLPGVADVEIGFVGAGELLERLGRPGNEGRRWLFFNELVLGPQWCAERFERARRVAQDRYTPERHVPLAPGRVTDALAVSTGFQQRLERRAKAVGEAVPRMLAFWPRWRDIHERQAAAEDGGQNPGFIEHLADGISRNAERVQGIVDQLAAAVDCISASAGAPSADLVKLADHLAEALVEFRDQVAELADGIRTEPPPSPAEETTASPSGTSLADRRQRLLAGPGPRPPTPSQALDFDGWYPAVRTVDQLRAALADDAARAAEAGAWVLLGPAGQGKTHLLLDGTRRALADSRLAAVVFGEELKGEDPLTEIASRLGLGTLPHDLFLQALDAAGAASNARFLLVVDAINDSDEAHRWKTQLPGLLARLADYPNVAVALSCRSTLRDVVLPANLDQLGVVSTEHPGFDGHEVEALEQYLRDVPHALPRTPLLVPAFSNPLFVKLYADGLRARALRTGGAAAVAGSQHRTAVFDLFLDTRADLICDQLRLDRASRPVHRAIDQLAARMAETGREVLDRNEARSIVDPFAPGRVDYPDTMLGKLYAHGLLTGDRYYIPGAEPRVGVAFPYQAFSDDRIVRAVFEQHRAEVDELSSTGRIAAGSPLRRWLSEASPALQEAATVVVPELAGVELIDVLDAADSAAADHPPRRGRYRLFRCLVDTLPLRDAASVTRRTVDLLNQAVGEHRLGTGVLEAVLAVTTEPGHPLNADRLHFKLIGLTRPERDAWWGVRIYSSLGEHGPLHRLLRWAEQLSTPARLSPDYGNAGAVALRARRAGTRPPIPADAAEPPPEVVRLAATTLTWTLTSSNRFLRDRATKALVQLLLGHPDVLIDLVVRFLGQDAERVNDPYLFERLTLVAYGVVLRAGHNYPDQVGRLAREILTNVYGDLSQPAHASRNVLLCDAARGIVGAAARMGQISDAEARRTAHPHPAHKPGTAPTDEQIEARFPSGRDVADSWSSVTLSLRGYGDFARYKVEPAIHRISRLPITHDRPPGRFDRRAQRPHVRPSRIAAFRSSLPVDARDVLGTRTSVERLLDQTWMAHRILNDEQYQLLRECEMPPPRDQRLFDTRQDENWAARWIVARVAAMGWDPARFGDFDRYHGRSGRDAHKAERIGKKYQWMALFEVGERLINHYHVNTGYDDERPDPAGFWQLLMRDLDPSLPPARHRLTDDDDEPMPVDDPESATFAPSPHTGFWLPPQPVLPNVNHVDEWILGDEPLPSLQNVAVRVDANGTRWVVVGEYANDTRDGRGFSGQIGQAEQWHHIDSWLVDRSHAGATLRFLDSRPLVPRWMPEARRPSQIYLGEFADGPAAHDPHGDQPNSEHELRFVDHYAADDPGNLAHQLVHMTRRSGRSPLARLLATDLDQPTTLVELAKLWRPGHEPSTAEADTDGVDDDVDEAAIDDLDDILLAPATSEETDEPSFVEVGRDSAGAAIQALPATQFYTWEANGVDCSIDTHVNVHLPANALLAGTDLVRHPDRPDWYDSAGTHVVTSRWALRTTGEVRTLLIREDWLDTRLNDLGFALIVGLFGNRIPVTDLRTGLEHWREYSQAASRIGGELWRFTRHLSTVRTTRRSRS